MLNETDNQKVSPVSVEKYLKGISFPSDKEKLIKQAEENNAPEEITDLLNQLADQDYENVTDISQEIGKFSA